MYRRCVQYLSDCCQSEGIVDGDRDQGVIDLREPPEHDRAHVDVDALTDRVIGQMGHQIGRHGRFHAHDVEVVIKRLHEGIEAQHGLDELAHVGPLVVGDRAEVCPVVRTDLLQDRVGKLVVVVGHGRESVLIDEPQPGVSVGQDDVLRNGLQVIGEPLVEPNVLPPFAGDQVACPLVGQFVGVGGLDAALVVRRRVGQVDQQGRFAVGDEAPVFHGAALIEPGADLGHLVQHVIEFEHLFEFLQELRRVLTGEVGQTVRYSV